MSAKEENRTTAIGLFHYAHSYACSAFTLTLCDIDCCFKDTPPRSLYTHAIELYLKSYLRLKGVSVKDLSSSELGHKISALRKKAQDFGLALDNNQEQQLDLLDNAIRDRYIKVGVRRILDLSALHELCIALNNEFGPQIYEYCNLSRAVLSIPAWEIKPN